MKWTSAAVGLLVSFANANSENVEYDGDVAILTDSNFEKTVMEDEKNVWFIKFYAPWCGHCKNMAPAWSELGTNLKGKVKIGKVDSTQESVSSGKFSVSSFPQIKLLPAGPKSVSMALDYEEGRDLGAMSAFALKHYQLTVEAEQIISGKQFEEQCANTLCVVAFLPHIYDSSKDGRNKYLKDYNLAARQSGGVPCTFLWSQGGDQFEFEEKLNLGFGYPALVAIHLKKGKFGIHRGSFEFESIGGFVRSLMSGRVPLNDLPKELPKLYKTEPWDGEDQKPAAEDEL